MGFPREKTDSPYIINPDRRKRLLAVVTKRQWKACGAPAKTSAQKTKGRAESG
jgi:hypothetical protein